MDENEKKYLDDTREYWAGFPEAPASDSFKWVDALGYEHLTTLRAYSPHLLLAQIGKVTNALADIGGKPINNKPMQAPVAQVQERDEAGLPVVDAEGKAVMINLPQGTNVYTVKALFHDKNKNGDKDLLKVVTEEAPYNTKYGVTCFHGGPDGWKKWPVGPDNKYMPTPDFAKVVIQAPEGEGKYANVVEFRKA